MSQQHIVQAPVSIKLTMSLSLCITWSRIELAFSYITLSHDPLHSLSGRARI